MNVFQKPENLCAAAMIGFFFLPWGQLFGIGASGYNLSQFGSYGNWAWMIPILASITLFMAFSGSTNNVLPIVTGAAPFVGLAYGLLKVGGDIFHVLAIGAYLTFIAGAGMILFSVGILGAESSASKSPKQTTAKFCTDCGAQNTPNSAFCTECGAKIK